MLKIIKTYLGLTKNSSPKIFYLFLILSPLVAFAQTAGIISIYPIITLITDPQIILKNIYFKKYFPFEFTDTKDLIFILVMGFILINILSLITFYNIVILQRYLAGKASLDLKNNLLSKLLIKKNFQKTIKNKSTFIAVVENEISKTSLVIESLLTIFQSLSIFIVFLLSIIYLEPIIIIIILAIAISYVLLFNLSKKKLKNISFSEVDLGKKATQHSLYINLGLKDLIALKIGEKIYNRLKNFRERLFKLDVYKIAIIMFPRYLFEIILYVIIGIFVLSFLDSKFLNQNLAKITILFVFLWKSIPLFFNFFRQASILLANKDSFEKIMQTFKLFSREKNSKIKSIKNFNKYIEFKKVTFQFENSINFEYNLKFNKGEKILLEGPSGSGKTTFLNILTGLLSDFKGTISLDNNNYDIKTYNPNFFGYVIQQPFLFSGTIFENVTFKNLKQKSIKKDNKLKKIYEICELNYIVEKYDEIFKKTIELDSPDLSGGQKQRVSIARVLYSEPKILILDEATNALDKVSEKNLFNNIFKNFPNLTIIVVTHRKLDLKFNKKFKITKKGENNYLLK